MSAGSIELVYDLGGKRHARRFDSGPVLIGRMPTCDVVVSDVSMSRQHARVTIEDGRWVLSDENSANGSYVNGRRVDYQPLSDGDRIRLGSVEITCRLAEAEEPAIDLDDSEERLTQSIAIGDFDDLVESVLRTDTGVRPDVTVPDVRDPTRVAPADAIWIIKILKKATDALLSHDKLDETLEEVMDLLFESLPVDRGFILLYREDTDKLIPKVERARPGFPPERLRISRHIADAAIKSKQAVLVQDAVDDERFNMAESIAFMGIRSAMCAPLYHAGHVGGLIYLDRTSQDQAFSETDLQVLSILATLSAAAVDRARLQDSVEKEKKIRARLSRYHAPAVIDHIIKADDAHASVMTAEEREISVLFCDIVGFTSLSENLTAREVTALLNELFEKLTAEIFNEGGTLDKFIGDAIMAFFGAPLDQADHAARAVRAALQMQKRVVDFNATRDAAQCLGLRIGVNSGIAVVGDVGAVQRKDYTCIGDTVNVASRLESSVAKQGQVVIGPRTLELVQEMFPTEPLEKLQLKGKQHWVQPYLVIDAGAECPPPARGE